MKLLLIKLYQTQGKLRITLASTFVGQQIMHIIDIAFPHSNFQQIINQVIDHISVILLP